MTTMMRRNIKNIGIDDDDDVHNEYRYKSDVDGINCTAAGENDDSDSDDDDKVGSCGGDGDMVTSNDYQGDYDDDTATAVSGVMEILMISIKMINVMAIVMIMAIELASFYDGGACNADVVDLQRYR